MQKCFKRAAQNIFNIFQIAEIRKMTKENKKYDIASKDSKTEPSKMPSFQTASSLIS